MLRTSNQIEKHSTSTVRKVSKSARPQLVWLVGAAWHKARARVKSVAARAPLQARTTQHTGAHRTHRHTHAHTGGTL